MARTDPVFNLRMPLEMKDELAERAKKNGRSLNAEIVQVLDDAIKADSFATQPDSEIELRKIIIEQGNAIEEYRELLGKMTAVAQAMIDSVPKKNKENHKPALITPKKTA